MVLTPSADDVVLISLEEELGVSIAWDEVDLTMTGVLVDFDSVVFVI